MLTSYCQEFVAIGNLSCLLEGIVPGFEYMIFHSLANTYSKIPFFNQSLISQLISDKKKDIFLQCVSSMEVITGKVGGKKEG